MYINFMMTREQNGAFVTNGKARMSRTTYNKTYSILFKNTPQRLKSYV